MTVTDKEINDYARLTKEAKGSNFMIVRFRGESYQVPKKNLNEKTGIRNTAIKIAHKLKRVLTENPYPKSSREADKKIIMRDIQLIEEAIWAALKKTAHTIAPPRPGKKSERPPLQGMSGRQN